MTRALSSAALLALVLWHGAHGSAQDAPPSVDGVPVNDLFAMATRAFERGDYEEALVLFRRAYDLVPRAAVRFNIAVCLERLGRLRDAWLEYRAAIAPDDLSEAQLQRAESEAARLRALLAVVEVRGGPSGADVRVDGVSACQLPCSVEVDPGARVISAHHGGRSMERGVRLDRGQRLTVELLVASEPVPTPEAVAEADLSQPSGEPEPAASVGGGRSVGWLTGVGAALAAAGIGGVVGFGLRTRSLHDQWLGGGPADVRDEGLTMRALTNTSIGVAVLGGVLVLVDIVMAARRGAGDTSESSAAWRAPRF